MPGTILHIYLMLSVKLDTGFNIEVEFPLTPFHRRLFAWLFDLLIMISYIWVFEAFISRSIPSEYGWIYILYILPALFYHLLMEIFFHGQSVGKKLMHIKVITLEGGQPSLSQYLIRWMFRLVDFGFFLLPGFFCVILSARSQRVGDLIAGTIVIDTTSKTTWQDTIFTELEISYRPKYSQVMQLSDKDINTLKGVINTVRKRNDYDLAHRISERVQSKLNIQADEDSLEFLERLLKDYNYYSTNN